MSLFRKLILSLSLFALAPILSLGALNYAATVNVLEAAALSNLQSIAEIEGQKINALREEVASALAHLADDRQLRGRLPAAYAGDEEALSAAAILLQEELASLDPRLTALLLSPNNEVLVAVGSNAPSAFPVGEFDHGYFRQTGEGRWYLAQSRALGAGALQLQHNIDYLFDDQGGALNLGRNGELILIHQDESGQRMPLHQPPPTKPTSGKSADNTPFIQAEYALPTLQASVIARKSKQDVIAPAKTQLMQMGGLAGLMALVAIAMAYIWSRWIHAPLAALAEVADQIEGGHLQQRLPEDTASPELTTLARSFNKMLDCLCLHNASLEEAVAVRTRELEEARIKAEEKSRVQSDFLANMSHEIRTPMNGILGISTLLGNTPLDARQQEYLNIIRRSARSLLVILNDILDLSKLRAGKLYISPVRFNLSELIKDLLEEAQAIVGERDIRVVCEKRGATPEWVFADPVRIKQILNNLLANAVKFTEQGKVTLELSYLPENEDQGELQFCVADTGIGIPLKKQDSIFEAFSQADSSTTRRFGGTGLGLTIVARLVTLMKGRVWLESQVSKGSRFYVALPAQANTDGQTHQAAPDVQDTAVSATDQGYRNEARLDTRPGQTNTLDDLAAVPLSILVAEDNKTNQRVLVDLLTARGHHLTVVDNGLAAVQAFRNGHFDQILMDVQMPVMDGFEAAEKIREIEGETGHPIPIVALTAHALRGDDQRCYSAGMSDYLAKPIDPALLINKIEGDVIDHVVDVARLQQRPANEETGQSNMVLDKNRLSDITRNNTALMRSIAKLFLDELPEMLSGIEDARHQGNPQILSQAMHRLKSALGNFVTSEYYKEIAHLESLAVSAPTQQWQESWRDSQVRLNQLIVELKDLSGL